MEFTGEQVESEKQRKEQSNRTNAKNDKVMLTADEKQETKATDSIYFSKFKRANQILSLEKCIHFCIAWIRGMQWRFWCIVNAQKRHQRSISICSHCQKRHNFRMLMQSIIIDCKCEFFLLLSLSAQHSMGHFRRCNFQRYSQFVNGKVTSPISMENKINISASNVSMCKQVQHLKKRAAQ